MTTAKATPKIVCLCGSTRFVDTFRKMNLQFTLEGWIVLSIGCDTKSDDALELDDDAKRRLDELHLHKIDMADLVYILNVDGYVGDSTRNEIAYATLRNKEIRWLHGSGADFLERESHDLGQRLANLVADGWLLEKEQAR